MKTWQLIFVVGTLRHNIKHKLLTTKFLIFITRVVAVVLSITKVTDRNALVASLTHAEITLAVLCLCTIAYRAISLFHSLSFALPSNQFNGYIFNNSTIIHYMMFESSIIPIHRLVDCYNVHYDSKTPTIVIIFYSPA